MISNELLKYTILKTAIYEKFVKATSKFKIFDLDKVVDVIPTKHFQIKQSEIKKEGKYPVVSQSQSLVEGYSNDYDKVFRPNSSCVIFGDHSKTIKYIDFPFIVGADGTKVIQPKSMLNSKYLYYHLIYNVAQIKSTGYTRNFKYLKKLKLYIPSLEEQEKIVKKIEELFALIDKKEKNDKEKEKLKTLLKEKILDSAIHGKLVENDLSLPVIDVEEVKEDVPFDIPSNWKWVNVLKVCDIVMGQSPNGESVNNIKGIEFHQGKKLFGEKFLLASSEFTTTPTKIIEPNTIVMSVRAPVGDINITPRKICIGRGLCSFSPNSYLNNMFLYYLLKFNYKDINSMSKGTTFVSITAKDIKRINFPIPPLEQQKKIVEKIEECFKLIEQL